MSKVSIAFYAKSILFLITPQFLMLTQDYANIIKSQILHLNDYLGEQMVRSLNEGNERERMRRDYEEDENIF